MKVHEVLVRLFLFNKKYSKVCKYYKESEYFSSGLNMTLSGIRVMLKRSQRSLKVVQEYFFHSYHIKVFEFFKVLLNFHFTSSLIKLKKIMKWYQSHLEDIK